MHNPLCRGLRFRLSASRFLPPSRSQYAIGFQVKDNMLSHAADVGDAAVLERGRDSKRRGLQRLAFLAKPHRVNHVSGHAAREALRDRLNFREFRHANPVYRASAVTGLSWRRHLGVVGRTNANRKTKRTE